VIGGSVPEELIHELAKLAPGRSFRRVWSEDEPTGRSRGVAWITGSEELWEVAASGGPAPFAGIALGNASLERHLSFLHSALLWGHAAPLRGVAMSGWVFTHQWVVRPLRPVRSHRREEPREDPTSRLRLQTEMKEEIPGVFNTTLGTRIFSQPLSTPI